MSHKKYREEKNCLNCGTEVVGRFCHQCGQENIETRDNFFHIAWHFISDYFHFDSKFFRSLIPLFTKPGFLTKEYWDGRRVHYIPPLRLFFFVTIIFMISTSYFYNRFGDDLKQNIVKSDSTFIKYDTSQLAHLHDSVNVYVPEEKDSLTVKQIKESKIRSIRQLTKLRAGVDSFFVYLKYVTFFLLPVYAIVFKILYRRRKTFYVDHLVYVMHLQSFIYCILTVVLILPFIFPQILRSFQALVLLIVFIYVGVSLHYLYHQPWWKTVLKSMIATFLLFFVTVLTMVGFAAVNAIYLQ